MARLEASMLDRCFRRARVCERIRANPLGPELEQLTAHLLERGYGHGTIQQYLQAAEHFGRWVGRVRRSRPIDESLVRRFLEEHLPRCRCRMPRSSHRIQVRAALRHLLRVVSAPKSEGPGTAAAVTSIEAVIQVFDQYMRDACGLAEATRLYRRRYAREFLTVKFGRRPIDFHRLGPADPMDFVADYAVRCSPATAQVAGSSLRCFLRFVHWRGWCDERLAQAVPGVPHWELSSLPKVMSGQELQQFLKSFDRNTATGRRDYAMALCMADLGLRVSDVVRLCLSDIDWRKATLHIVGGKSRRSGILPLPRRVGEAIAAYLRNGRPQSQRQELFLRHRAPLSDPVSKDLARGAMRRAYRRCGLNRAWTGTHILRHTAASRMNQRGASLKQIADVLGHRSIDTSKVYTKVNVPMLATVALPWPEVSS
jgi:site-specific recombinase XerD